jgi:glycosyltransferase involved in cell wall biosynthesis
MPLVSVALPVYRAADTLRGAAGCLLAQTHSDLDIMLVLNGSDAETTSIAHDIARADPRVRVLTLPEPHLAAALNAALNSARSNLVARMDADDTCEPERIAQQAEYMTSHPKVAALGSAWEQADSAGRVLATVRPPTDPRETRWRLLLGNPFAHGSMMLRRDAVLAMGGYHTAYERAQDYELWLRLSAISDVCALPRVLYRHHSRGGTSYSASHLQAQLAARIMVGAWRGLPPSDDGEVSLLLSEAMSNSATASNAAESLAEEMTSHGATIESLLAYLWVGHTLPPMTRAAAEISRRSHAHVVATELKSAGVRRLWLWGAGAHSAWLLPVLRDEGITVQGLVDDALAGTERLGFMVARPDTLAPGTSVLLSSDAFEDKLWEASTLLRDRGVRVHRMYTGHS